MSRTILFTWGYYGWGNATPYLVEAVDAQSDDEKLHRIVGPAIRQKDQWALPILSAEFEAAAGLADLDIQAKKLRREFGLEPVSA